MFILCIIRCSWALLPRSSTVTSTKIIQNSDREILEPLLPFCAFDSEWESIPYGKVSVWDDDGKTKMETSYRHYCNSFRPSFTDRGICYSWNSLEPSKVFSESDYIQHTDEIFQYTENKSSVLIHPNANGPNYGFRFIVDTHTLSSDYKQDSNTNKDIEIVLHEGTELPYFKYIHYKLPILPLKLPI